MKESKSSLSESVISWIINYRLHLIFWAIYCFYESVLTGIYVGRFGDLENYLVHYSLNLTLFYVHANCMDRLDKMGFYFFKVVLLAVFEIALYIPTLALLNHLFTNYNQGNAGNWLGIDYQFVSGASYRSIFFIIVSSGYWFLLKYLDERKKSELLERERLNAIVKNESAEKKLLIAQNARLRAQISPHFLFNTLSFVYRRIKKTDELAGDVIVLLTSMMRFAIDASEGKATISLQSELDQVTDLIQLLQLIKNSRFNLSVKYDHGLEIIEIIPLVLLTLVENMYKHGDLSNPDQKGILNIVKVQNSLQIKTENLKSEISYAVNFNSGLKNLEKRLIDFYGRGAALTSHSEGEWFLVKILIPL